MITEAAAGGGGPSQAERELPWLIGIGVVAGVAGLGGAAAAIIYATRKKERREPDLEKGSVEAEDARERAAAAVRRAMAGPRSAPAGAVMGASRSGADDGRRAPRRPDAHDSRIYRSPGTPGRGRRFEDEF